MCNLYFALDERRAAVGHHVTAVVGMATVVDTVAVGRITPWDGPWATRSLWCWWTAVLVGDAADAAQSSQVEFACSLTLQLQRQTIARQLPYQRHSATVTRLTVAVTY